MRIDSEFSVGVPVERAWEVLTDLERITPCLPGAKLTGVEGDTYQGRMRVKVGPVVTEYAGTATFTELDETARRAVIDAKGRDSRGAGNASATVTAQLREDGDRTVVSVSTDMRVTGKIAQFGRGMIQQVSEKLLGQFADCLESKLATDAEPAPSSSAPASSAPPSSAPASSAPPSSAPAAESSSADRQAGSRDGERRAELRVVPDEATAPRQEQEPEPVDLVQVAGGAVARRLVPVLAGLVVVVVVWYLLAR